MNIDDRNSEPVDDVEIVDDVADVEEPEDLVVDDSVEINVEELVAKIESEDENASRDAKLRRKLDKVRDENDPAFDSTYNFNLDEDL